MSAILNLWGLKVDNNRLKIKIGDCEFEAEGPEESVQAQFEAFKELVLNASVRVNTESASTQTAGPKNGQGEVEPPPPPATVVDDQLDKIMQLDDERIVSLTAPPESLDEAVLLLVFGQRQFRQNSKVTGNEIMEGLRMSGRIVERVDRNLQKAADNGDILSIGKKRGKRYRLTNQGLAKARKIAKERIEVVA